MGDFAFRHPDGGKERGRRYPSVTTKRGAEQYERELRRAISNPRKEAPTFESFAVAWIETYPAARGSRRRTIEEKKSILRLWSIPFFARHRPDEIRGHPPCRILAHLERYVRSDKPPKNVRATLRTMSTTAARCELLHRLPGLPRIPVTESEVDPRDRGFASTLTPSGRT